MPPHAALPSASLSVSTLGDSDDWYFVHGFMGKLSRYSAMAGGIRSGSLALVTIIGTSTLTEFDLRLHTALDYPEESLIKQGGRSQEFLLPPGLSGAPVWRTHWNEKSVPWVPEDAEFVGIVTRWDKEAQALIMLRAEAVRECFLDFIRREFAYYHWLNRGKPSNDDWCDWFQATSHIPDLFCMG